MVVVTLCMLCLCSCVVTLLIHTFKMYNVNFCVPPRFSGIRSFALRTNILHTTAIAMNSFNHFYITRSHTFSFPTHIMNVFCIYIYILVRCYELAAFWLFLINKSAYRFSNSSYTYARTCTINIHTYANTCSRSVRILVYLFIL